MRQARRERSHQPSLGAQVLRAAQDGLPGADALQQGERRLLRLAAGEFRTLIGASVMLFSTERCGNRLND